MVPTLGLRMTHWNRTRDRERPEPTNGFTLFLRLFVLTVLSGLGVRTGKGPGVGVETRDRSVRG